MNVTGHVTGKQQKSAGGIGGLTPERKPAGSVDGSFVMNPFMNLLAPRSNTAMPKDFSAAGVSDAVLPGARTGKPNVAGGVDAGGARTVGPVADIKKAETAGPHAVPAGITVEEIKMMMRGAEGPAGVADRLPGVEKGRPAAAAERARMAHGETAAVGPETDGTQNREVSGNAKKGEAPEHRWGIPAESAKQEVNTPETGIAAGKPAIAGTPENTHAARAVKERNVQAIAEDAATEKIGRMSGMAGLPHAPVFGEEPAAAGSGKKAGTGRKEHAPADRAGEPVETLQGNRPRFERIDWIKAVSDGTNRQPENRGADGGNPERSGIAEKLRSGETAELLRAEPGPHIPGVGINAAHASGGTEPVLKLSVEQRMHVVDSAHRGVVEQIAQVISGAGKDEIRMRLFPPELGEIKIRVSMKDRKVKASFIVESAAVKSAVDGGTGRLAEAISQEGFTLENLDVSVNDSQKRSGWNGPDEETAAVATEGKGAVAAGGQRTRTQTADGIDLLA